MDYQKQATDWCEKWGVTYRAEFLRPARHIADDTDTRDIYRCTLTRTVNGRTIEFSAGFGQSLNNSRRLETSTGPYWDKQNRRSDYSVIHPKSLKSAQVAPTAYDFLACIEKGEPLTFAEWCSDYGYDTDSIKAKATWEACQEQALRFTRFCGGEGDMLTEARDMMKEIGSTDQGCGTYKVLEVKFG